MTRPKDSDDPRRVRTVLGDDGGLSGEILSRLGGREHPFGRYRVKDEVARGGQGAVLKVWDEDLRRHLAMKVLLGRDDGPGQSSKTLGRFLEEAQVTGQLDHPGIVPVHELGLDDSGRVYFTMKLVKGEELGAIFARVSAGDSEWTQGRALEVLLKVCDAMAYAHDKGVIHRDLKPSNVMVGRYGAVYVMDWGVARVLDRDDAKDIRIRPPADATELVQSPRRELADSPDSSLVTMDGDVVGTPAYMSPEQARGDLAAMGPQTDVYAVGAMLYHMLTGRMPYVAPDAKLNNYAVWGMVQEGPPRAIADLVPTAPPELTAICEKAMARERDERYAEMKELADDLRAFLEGRVVRAYRSGPWIEARKWVRRNRGLAASVLAALLFLVVGSGGIAFVQARGKRAADEERDRAALLAEQARESEDSARTHLEQAELERERAASSAAAAEFLLVLIALEEMLEEVDTLWPALPSELERLQAWSYRAEQNLGMVRELRPLFEQHMLPHSRDPAGWTLQLDGQPGALVLGDEAFSGTTYVTQLGTEVDYTDLIVRAMRVGVVLASDSSERGLSVQRRIETALALKERTLTSPGARERWGAAIDSIADRTQCPEYDGLALRPIGGLLPLGRDEHSGLWEFWHAPTGDEPRRGDDGRLVMTPDSGVVLVLVPGGAHVLGEQSESADRPNHTSWARRWGSRSTVEVDLEPYFISKYELTEGQWHRAMTILEPGGAALFPPTEKPVSAVTWFQLRAVLPKLGLRLPTENEWEAAARAGTETPWWSGEQPLSLTRAFLFQQDKNPAGRLAPNPYGLHDTLNNVQEWTSTSVAEEVPTSTWREPSAPGDVSRFRVVRGGDWTMQDPSEYSSGARYSRSPWTSAPTVGVRPAMSLSLP